MNPNERPLTAAERQQLRGIRQRRANRNARREIQDDQYFKGADKTLFAIFAGAAFVFWPWLVWHGVNSQGDYTWDRGTWIATPIWWGFLALCALLIWSGKEARTRNPQRQRRDGGA
jgi:hypothetical protein